MNKKRIKILFGFLFFVLLIGGTAQSAHAGTWRRDGLGWWYQREDGGYPANAWEMIGGKWYYFWQSGYMAEDTHTPDGYYVDETGAWDPNYSEEGSRLKIEDLDNTLYVKETQEEPRIYLEFGSASEGTRYLAVWEGDNLLWYGMFSESLDFGEYGVQLMFTGTEEFFGNWLSITWNSRESMDFPEVDYYGDAGDRISGNYSYDRMLFGN